VSSPGVSGQAPESRRPHPVQLDEMSVGEIVGRMNELDQRLPALVHAALPAISAAIEAAEVGFSVGGRLVYVGAGTSGRLGVLDAAECPPTFHTDPARVVGVIAGGPDALVAAVEGAEDDSAAGAAAVEALDLGPLDSVVGVAASGRTPYVLGALEHARQLRAVTVSLSCVAPAELSRVAAWPIEVPVGPEIIAGSTRLKAGTVTKQVLNMISTALMVRTGRTYGDLMVEVAPTNAKLRARATGLVVQIAGVDPDTARSALESAGLEVKTATVMLLREVDATTARALLDSVGGRLGSVIGGSGAERPGLGPG
jgi:N-acetylmuramic acid 6-phosphate etherase